MKPRNENFVPKSSYELPELIECGYGKLFWPSECQIANQQYANVESNR